MEKSSQARMIAGEIKTIVAEQVSKSKNDVQESSTLESLGMDSLDRVEVVMKIEEKFNIEMSDEKVDTVRTIGELISYVESLKSRLKD